MRMLYIGFCFQVATIFCSVGFALASELPACPSSGYWHKCFGTYTFDPNSKWSGDKYLGEFRNNKFDGQGTYYFSNGDIFVGKYIDNVPNGRGTYYYLADNKFKGDKFVGEYRNGIRNGQGTYYFLANNEFKGDKFVGEYKDSMPNGQGTYYYLADNEFKGDKFVGEYRDGTRNGIGTYYYLTDNESKGSKFVGEYRDDKRHGHGTLTYGPNSNHAGDKYVGEYRDDIRHGQGTYIFSDGTKYTGEFKNGALNGYAVQYLPDGTIFKEGIFEDNKFLYASLNPNQSELPECPTSGFWHECFGTNTFDSNSKWSGDKYVGEFRNNNFDGKGIYYHASGNKYVGGFREGKRYGQGTYTFAKGDKYVGEFRNNKFDGQGTFYFSNGDIFVGKYIDNVPNGRGTYYYLADDKFEGDKFVGEYRNGIRNGQGTYYFLANNEFKGSKFVGEYRDDKRHGHGTFTYGPNSNHAGDKFVGEYKDSMPNGRGTYYFADGRKDVGEFKDGVLDGYAIQYDADGSILKEGIFKDDEFLYAQKITPAVPVEKAPIERDEIISASSGSGFAVSSNGYVITNYHVVEGCEKVVVHTKDNDHPMRLITYDPKNDLALLKGDFRPKTVFALSNSRPELLQDIYVAGFPFGDKFSTSIKVTKGIVSSLTGLGNNFSNIQIDAALQSGNSGGPILDDFGNVVGVAVAKLDAKYMFDEFGIIPENTNFGIKSSVVRSVLESNNVDSPSANKLSITKSQLGEMISNGTYYISCWMTLAQINEMKSKKVFFNNLD
jgi:hypothetical protein